MLQHDVREPGLIQEHVDRRVGDARLLTGMTLVAAVGGCDSAGRFHADNGPRLGEGARSFARLGVEQEPRNGVVDRGQHARLYHAGHFATVEIFPGWSGVVLADELTLRVEKLRIRSLEDPAGGAQRVAATGIDLHASTRCHLEDQGPAGTSIVLSVALPPSAANSKVPAASIAARRIKSKVANPVMGCSCPWPPGQCRRRAAGAFQLSVIVLRS